MLFLEIHEARTQKSPEQIYKILSKQLDFVSWFGFTPKAGAQKHLLNTWIHLLKTDKEIWEINLELKYKSRTKRWHIEAQCKIQQLSFVWTRISSKIQTLWKKKKKQ